MTRKPWEHAKSEGSEGDPLASRFVSSLDTDTRLYRVDIKGSLAHANMLHATGLIDQSDLSAIERGLTEIREEIEAAPGGIESWPGWKVELEDVHMCIEAALIERIGEAGRRLHTGRSRNDQVALDLALWINEEARSGLHVRLTDLIDAFGDLARRDGDLTIPGYTHLQRAQPICVGGELVAWSVMFADDRRSLPVIRENPLGSGALAGSSLAIDREATSAALGFDRPTMSSLATTASRDHALDLLYVLSKIAMHLSRWAEQWIIYATTEFGFITLDHAHTTGSSMMPQKRNPDMLELIRGKCGGVYGNLVAMLTICKGLTIGYNRDLQEDKRHLFGSYDTVCDCLEMAMRIVQGCAFSRASIERGIDRGYLDATSLADYFVTNGVPFRTAHQVVGRLVSLCDDSGRHRLADLTADEIRAAVEEAGHDASWVDGAFNEWLTAGNVVQRYRSIGNAGSGFKANLTGA